MYMSIKCMCILSGLKKHNIVEHIFCMGGLWGVVGSWGKALILGVEGAEREKRESQVPF